MSSLLSIGSDAVAEADLAADPGEIRDDAIATRGLTVRNVFTNWKSLV